MLYSREHRDDTGKMMELTVMIRPMRAIWGNREPDWREVEPNEAGTGGSCRFWVILGRSRPLRVLAPEGALWQEPARL
jgi:hypothetical protein